MLLRAVRRSQLSFCTSPAINSPLPGALDAGPRARNDEMGGSVREKRSDSQSPQRALYDIVKSRMHPVLSHVAETKIDGPLQIQTTRGHAPLCPLPRTFTLPHYIERSYIRRGAGLDLALCEDGIVGI